VIADKHYKCNGGVVRLGFLKRRAVEPELKFLWIRASKFFGSCSEIYKFLAPAPERFGPLKTKNHCNNGTTRSPQKLSVKPEPEFQAPAPPSKNFWLDSSHPKSLVLQLRLHSPAWGYERLEREARQQNIVEKRDSGKNLFFCFLCFWSTSIND